MKPHIELRPYQQQALAAINRSLNERTDNPCAVLPTGSGKGVLIGKLCADLVNQGKRVLALSHVRELVGQNAKQVSRFLPDGMVGVNCNGLGRRDATHPVLVASIKSVYQRAAYLGHFDVALIDECHMIGDEGMYQSLFTHLKAINPALRIVGLTATPFRMFSGSICGPDRIFSHIVYQIGVGELIQQDYLSPLLTKSGTCQPDTANIQVRAGDFDTKEVEHLMANQFFVESACKEIVDYTRERRAVLIFASGISHAKVLADILERISDEPTATIFSHTSLGLRDRKLQDFAEGRIKYLINVSVLTTGYDFPGLDCVAIVRPTKSVGLYYQMTGRGLRIHPGKQDCLVLDYGGNIARHGAIDDLRFGQAIQELDSSRYCSICGLSPVACRCQSLDERVRSGLNVKHEGTASSESILKTVRLGERVKKISYFPVHSMNSYPPNPPALRVVYELENKKSVSESVNFQAGNMEDARKWWSVRCELPLPRSMVEAWKMAMKGALREPGRIHTQKGNYSGWLRVVNHDFTCAPVHSRHKAFSCVSYSPEVFKR